MPFVTIIQNPDSPVKHDPEELEKLCKEAWEEMKYNSNSGPFEAVEVGGLMALDANVMTGRPGSCVLFFYYSERPDRGLDFRGNLLEELRARLPRSIDVIPVATKHWFKDPVWSIRVDCA